MRGLVRGGRLGWVSIGQVAKVGRRGERVCLGRHVEVGVMGSWGVAYVEPVRMRASALLYIECSLVRAGTEGKREIGGDFPKSVAGHS